MTAQSQAKMGVTAEDAQPVPVLALLGEVAKKQLAAGFRSASVAGMNSPADKPHITGGGLSDLSWQRPCLGRVGEVCLMEGWCRADLEFSVAFLGKELSTKQPYIWCRAMGKPADIADAVLLMASNKSRCAHGVGLSVDAGLSSG